MTHLPTVARSFQVTVPTRAAADGLADALAARGHLLVAVRVVDHFFKDPASPLYGKPSLRPDEQGQWDVFSLVTGPVPDEDVEWWLAQEDEAVRRLAARFGGRTGSSGGGPTDLMIRTFTRVGLVHELDEANAASRRLAALADSPARASEREPRKVDENLPDGPGAPIAVGPLDAVDWGRLTHAYGPAGDVPALLRALAANDDEWDDAHGELCGSVLHQGSTYSATAPALRVLTQIAIAAQLAPKRRLDLLYTLFLAGSELAEAQAHGYRPDAYALEARAAVAGDVERLMTLWPSVSRAEQRLLLLLAALAEHAAGPSDLHDPASRLALAMVDDTGDAESVLRDLASRNEDLLELAEGDAPLHSRLVASLRTLLWEP